MTAKNGAKLDSVPSRRARAAKKAPSKRAKRAKKVELTPEEKAQADHAEALRLRLTSALAASMQAAQDGNLAGMILVPVFRSGEAMRHIVLDGGQLVEAVAINQVARIQAEIIAGQAQRDSQIIQQRQADQVRQAQQIIADATKEAANGKSTHTARQ